MNWWHRLSHRKQMEEQLEKEIRFHLERHTADLVAEGRGRPVDTGPRHRRGVRHVHRLDGVLLKLLPYGDPGRLAAVHGRRGVPCVVQPVFRPGRSALFAN